MIRNPEIIKQEQKNAEMPNESIDKLGLATEKSDNQEYILKLFVISNTPDSSRAIKNINIICEKYLKGRYSLEIIDINEHPEWATNENIFAIPLLLKKNPLPAEKLIGDLSDTQKILTVFNII